MPEVSSYSKGEQIILHFYFFVIRNPNFRSVYLKNTFLSLVDRFDRNISVLLACSRSDFVQNFCCHATKQNFFQFKPHLVFIPEKVDFSAC